jgi:hypothetical protein
MTALANRTENMVANAGGMVGDTAQMAAEKGRELSGQEKGPEV